MNKSKGIISIVTAFLSSLLGVLYVPVILMVTCSVIDYITGFAAAKYRGGISSYKSFKGIVKKVFTWTLVVIGSIIDQLIKYAAEQVGYEVHITFLVACIVAIWISCNEIISILENMIDIGVEIPSFLMPIVRNIKSKAERLAEKEGDKDDERN